MVQSNSPWGSNGGEVWCLYGLPCRAVAGDAAGRSCRSSAGARPLRADQRGYIELNWDDDDSRAGRGGHVTAGACRWTIVAERGQRINLTLYHFGPQPSFTSNSRWDVIQSEMHIVERVSVFYTDEESIFLLTFHGKLTLSILLPKPCQGCCFFKHLKRAGLHFLPRTLC